MRTPKTAPSAPRDAAMDGGLQDGCLQGGGLQDGGLQGGGSDVEAMHVRTETVDESESPSALVVSSQEPPARCGGGGGGAAEEAATCPPVLLSSATPPAPPSTSDFSSRTVLCLIEAIGRRWGLYETRERSQLFQSVQEEMASKGHRLPVNKIRRKWNNLIVTYKRVKDRSRETGHASWEFFDLMDAMLCDTVGSQIIINRRKKCTGSVSFTKVAVKPAQLVQPPPPAASLWPGADPGHMTSTAVSTSNAPELKPPIVVSGDGGRTSSHPSSVVPPITSSPGFTETATSRPPDGTASTTDLNTSSYTGFSPGVVPYLSTPPCSLHQDIFTSSLCPTSCCLSPPTATPKTRGQNQMGRKEQSSVVVFQEILRRQKEQAYLDGVARRRVEAREKRRERREVRMSESLDRIASALELLSSKQDTVIRLLQRLANRP